MSKIHELAFNAEEIDALLDSVDKKTIYQDATQSEHGLMSTTDKTKLDALPTAQQIGGALNAKVDMEAGKGLSENDYTDAEKESVASAYHKPKNGIPKTDLDSSVQTSLNKADTALQSFTETDPTVPSWAKQQNKPSYNYNEIGNTPDLSGFITKSVNDLTNYYLKSETYTKAEVAELIGATQQFHYEIYATLPQSGESNVLYLIGPIGTGKDKYEEYVYANGGFVPIGDTSIDLSGYVTTDALNTALAGYVSSSDLATALSAYTPTSNLATVATSGEYDDLKNKPTIPAVPIQDVTVGGTSVVSNGTAVIPEIPDVSGKADKVLVATTEPSGGMLPNVLYEFGELSGNTTFTIATPSDNTIANHYYWTFDTPSAAPTITWPQAITSWFGGSAPTISASKHYEISVLNGIAIAMEA